MITHCLGKNQEPKQIQRVLNAQRQAKRIEFLKIWAIRRACRGVTHQHGRSDGRGRVKHCKTHENRKNRYENCC